MPRSNIAFLADAFGSMMGGVLGSSALTTYVESAAAMREGGRTGATACVCAVFFLLSIVLWWVAAARASFHLPPEYNAQHEHVDRRLSVSCKPETRYTCLASQPGTSTKVHGATTMEWQRIGSHTN
jgi:hypothetical protein